MKKKVLKKIDAKVDDLLIEWLKSILNEDDRDQITKENYKQFLPTTKYILSKRTHYLSFYTYRWARQGTKKLLKKGFKLKDITLGDLIWLLKKQNRSTQSSIL